MVSGPVWILLNGSVWVAPGSMVAGVPVSKPVAGIAMGW